MLRPLFLIAALPSLASAGVSEVINDHILPGYATFAKATSALSDIAETDCTPEAVKPAYNDAFDAWLAISHIQFGPVEDNGRMLRIAFWPDAKNSTGKALGTLTAKQDPVVNTPETYAEVSVAAQGLFALERVLYEPQPDAAYACALTRAISATLAQTAETVNAEWPAFAGLMLAPGADGNTRFMSQTEVEGTLYTSLMTGIEFNKDTRLGRPMGTAERPRPSRAEAYRSARSQRNVELSLSALQQLADSFSDVPTPLTDTTFSEAIERTRELQDPTFAGVEDPIGRFRMEALQNVMGTISSMISDEIGLPMGLSAGFNALDGD